MFKKVAELLTDEVESGRAGVRELAKKLNMAPASLRRYSEGSVEPRQDKMESIAKYFDVSVAYLRGEDNIGNLFVKSPENHYGKPAEDDLVTICRYYAGRLTTEEKEDVIAYMARLLEERKRQA